MSGTVWYHPEHNLIASKEIQHGPLGIYYEFVIPDLVHGESIEVSISWVYEEKLEKLGWIKIGYL